MLTLEESFGTSPGYSTSSNAVESTATTANSTGIFEPPPHYSFPPFYTLQPNLTTRHAQLTLWSSLLVSYCAHNRLFLLSPTDAIFSNQTLRKRFAPADVRVLFQSMVEQGRADWVDSSLSGKKKKTVDASKDSPESAVHIWWKLPEEWSALLLGWVEDTGQKGAVLTFYELREGCGGKSWGGEGMPEDCLRRILQTLIKKGKASVFGSAEEEGVKFF